MTAHMLNCAFDCSGVMRWLPDESREMSKQGSARAAARDMPHRMRPLSPRDMMEQTGPHSQQYNFVRPGAHPEQHRMASSLTIPTPWPRILREIVVCVNVGQDVCISNDVWIDATGGRNTRGASARTWPSRVVASNSPLIPQRRANGGVPRVPAANVEIYGPARRCGSDKVTVRYFVRAHARTPKCPYHSAHRAWSHIGQTPP